MGRRIRWRNLARLGAGAGALALVAALGPDLLEAPHPEPLPPDVGLPETPPGTELTVRAPRERADRPKRGSRFARSGPGRGTPDEPKAQERGGDDGARVHQPPREETAGDPATSVSRPASPQPTPEPARAAVSDVPLATSPPPAPATPPQSAPEPQASEEPSCSPEFAFECAG